MTSIPEIYSLPDTFSNLGGSCSDQELISSLREYRILEPTPYFEPHRKINHAAARLKNLPWKFIRLKLEAMEGWTTDEGTWSQKKLVSIPNTSQGNSPNSAKFVGTKTTLEFKPTGAKRGVVGMTQYHLLRTMKDRPGLYLDVSSIFT